jgi:hypothetical protein
MLSRATMNVNSALQSVQNAEPANYPKSFIFHQVVDAVAIAWFFHKFHVN